MNKIWEVAFCKPGERCEPTPEYWIRAANIPIAIRKAVRAHGRSTAYHHRDYVNSVTLAGTIDA